MDISFHEIVTWVSNLSVDQLLSWFSQYTYQPYIVYGAIVVIMFLSSFGFPLPEEITLISAGLLGFFAKNTDLYPPPYPGAVPVEPFVLAMVAFLAVLLSDLSVYFLGRLFGARILDTKFMIRYKSKVDKIQLWGKKYGVFAAGIFRFTPGLRFPGHLSCGIIKVPASKFLMIDGAAALLSVPTQILLVSHYGRDILVYFSRFKVVLIGLVVAAIIGWIIYRFRNKHKLAASTNESV